MPKHFSLAVTVLSLAIPAFAAPASKKADHETALTPAELHDTAVSESAASGTRKAAASDVQITGGILKLEDPGLADRSSPWRWSAGVRLQTLTPHGREVMSNGQALNLEDVGSTVLPVVSLGVQRQLVKNEKASWSAGLAGEAGYATQSTNVTYPSGVRPTDTRLSTGTVAVIANVSARFEKLSSFEWQAGWTEGLITSSHSAPDNAVNFSRQGRFRGPRAGVSYWPTALVAIDLTGESLTSDLDTESGKVSLGARVAW